MPTPDLLPERLDPVLATVYLIFNQGYGGRGELAGEALWLGRSLVDLLPEQPEPLGLLALMLLHDAPRHAPIRSASWCCSPTRTASAGMPVSSPPAIAALHTKPRTDWLQVAVLYAELAQPTRSPVVQLNRAVAVAEVEGPAVALAMVDTLPLDEYLYLHSTRADLLRRLGRTGEAHAAYQRALTLTDDDAERRFLQRRMVELDASRP